MSALDTCATIKATSPTSALVEVRAPRTGKLVGKLDPSQMLLEVKVGKITEVIDLKMYQR